MYMQRNGENAATATEMVATHTSGMYGGGHAPISSSLDKGEPMDRMPWHAASRIVYSAHVKSDVTGSALQPLQSRLAVVLSPSMAVTSRYNSCCPFSICHPCHATSSNAHLQRSRNSGPKSDLAFLSLVFPGQPHATTLMCCLDDPPGYVPEMYACTSNTTTQ